MLKLLCCFGKNVVNKAIKMKKYKHVDEELRPAEPFFLQCVARGTFLVANAALGRI